MILSSSYIKRRDKDTFSTVKESHKNESLPYRFLFKSISENHLKHYFCCYNELFPSTRCHWRYDTYKGYFYLRPTYHQNLIQKQSKFVGFPIVGIEGLERISLVTTSKNFLKSKKNWITIMDMAFV